MAVVSTNPRFAPQRAVILPPWIYRFRTRVFEILSFYVEEVVRRWLLTRYPMLICLSLHGPVLSI